MNAIQPINAAQTEGMAIQLVAEESGNLSIALAEASGHLDAIDAALEKNANAVHSITDLIAAMSVKNRDVTDSAQTALSATATARSIIELGNARIMEASAQMTAFAADVAVLGEGIANLRGSLTEVSRVASEISDIARTTNILAINASIEAARAGPEGKGFMVVAQEIKQLANRTEAAINVIAESLQVLDGQNANLGYKSLAAQDGAQSLHHNAEGLAQVMSEIASATAQVDAQQSRIVRASELANQTVQQIGGDIGDLTTGIESAAKDLRKTRSQVSSLIGQSERIVGACATLDVQTVDSPFIAASVQAAAAISAAFDAAIERGEISLAQFFDTRLQEVAGSNPKQFLAPFTQMTDKILPPLQEPLLSLSDKVVFCAAVDRRGYLPTHNLKFSARPRPNDIAWNTANCRNRRIFDDRVGLAAGQNTQPFLLQAYRRDMGTGQFVMMKDVSAPIMIQGRHWGGLRLAYKVG